MRPANEASIRGDGAKYQSVPLECLWHIADVECHVPHPPGVALAATGWHSLTLPVQAAGGRASVCSPPDMRLLILARRIEKPLSGRRIVSQFVRGTARTSYQLSTTIRAFPFQDVVSAVFTECAFKRTDECLR
jgi:hypothetical protein